MPRGCHQCGLEKAQGAFSTTQWAKPAGQRRCKECVNHSSASVTKPAQSPVASSSPSPSPPPALDSLAPSFPPALPSVSSTEPRTRVSETVSEQEAEAGSERGSEAVSPQSSTKVEVPDLVIHAAAELPPERTRSPVASEKETVALRISQLECELGESTKSQQTQQDKILALSAMLQEVSENNKILQAENKQLASKCEELSRTNVSEVARLKAELEGMASLKEAVQTELQRLIERDLLKRPADPHDSKRWSELSDAQRLRHYLQRLEGTLEEKELDIVILSAQRNTLAQTARSQPIDAASFARLQAGKVERVRLALDGWTLAMRDVICEDVKTEEVFGSRLTFNLERNQAFDNFVGPAEDEAKWDTDTKVASALEVRDTGLVKSLLEGVAELSLAGASLTDLEIETLALAIQGHPTLRHVYLDNNQFGNVGCEALASALEGNRVLQTLSLEENHIGDAGASALVRAVQGCAQFVEGCVYCGKTPAQHPFCLVCNKAHEGPSEGRFSIQYRNPGGVGIRKEPAYPGERLQIDLGYLESVCVTQTALVKHSHLGKEYTIHFYKLADGRGWVHDFHPDWKEKTTIAIIPDQVCMNFELRDACGNCCKEAAQHPWLGAAVQRLNLEGNPISEHILNRLRHSTKYNRTLSNLVPELGLPVPSRGEPVSVPRIEKSILKRR